MHVIYYCYRRNPSSPIAAALHTGLLSPDRLATKAELEALPWFDKVSADQRGKLLLVGRDESETTYTCAGEGQKSAALLRPLSADLALAGGDPDSLYFVDTLPAVNVLMPDRRLSLPAAPSGMARQAPSRPWSSAGLSETGENRARGPAPTRSN